MRLPLAPFLLTVLLLAGCDVLTTGQKCYDGCGRAYTADPCGAGAVMCQHPLTFAVEPQPATCTGGSPCVKFSFTTTEAARLDRIDVLAPTGEQFPLYYSEWLVEPEGTYELQEEGTAYPWRTGRWFFTFTGVHVPEYREPLFEVTSEVRVRD